MRKIEKMITDDALQSAVEYGSHTFHFTTYCDKDDSLNGKHISWHWHREFQFSQVISGTVNYRIDMEKFSLSEGDCLFINNNIIHSYVVKNGIMKNAIFLDEFLAPVTSTVYRKYIAPVGASDLKYFVVRKEDVAMRELTERLKTLFGQDEIHGSWKFTARL